MIKNKKIQEYLEVDERFLHFKQSISCYGKLDNLLTYAEIGGFYIHAEQTTLL